MNANDHQHHTIWTPELVEISLPLAGVARRCMAMLVDQMLVFLLITGMIVLFVVLMGASMRTFTDSAPMVAMVMVIGTILMSVMSYFLYFWLFHTFNNGQTIGKMWLGIRLVTDRGGRPNAWTCFVRSVFDILDMILFYGGVSVIMILCSEREKRIADYAAGTIVILDR